MREMPTDPARSETLSMHPRTSYGSREIPCLAWGGNGAQVCIENPKGEHR